MEGTSAAGQDHGCACFRQLADLVCRLSAVSCGLNQRKVDDKLLIVSVLYKRSCRQSASNHALCRQL